MDISSFQIPFSKRIRNMGRFAQIVNVFARHGYWTVLERLDLRGVLNDKDLRVAESSAGTIDADAESLVGVPARFRKCLEELGPAFVKLGQILAVREDIVPAEFTAELRKLHSNVQSLPFDIIQQRLQEELGPERLARFRSIEQKPLAAGSMAQVHRAILDTGEDVVVKVQRPGIAVQIETDLNLMMTFAEMFERYIPESRSLRPTALVQSLADAVLGELDFVREASNMSKMAANFSNVSHIHMPQVHWPLSTGKVITLQMMAGIAVDDRDRLIAAGIDVKLLVSRGLEMFLKMVFVDGFFHGDMHPGNILCRENSEISLLDYGMVVRLSRRTRENLAGMLVALAREDFDTMVHHYLEIVEIGTDTDVQKFQHEIANSVSPYIGLSLKQSRSGKLLWELARIAAKHNAPFPQDLIIFVKTMATIEGVGTKLDPDFDMMKTCGEFATTLLKDLYSPRYIQDQAITIARDISGLMRHAPMMTRRLLNAAIDGHLRLNIQSEDAARVARALERGTSRLSISIVVGALLIGSSILVFASGNTQPIIGMGGFIMAGVLGLYIVGSVLRSGKF
ncbi:MAG: AarF/UbiB family protein [Proteobacteria bacterium]|nr:AarF/UbiB family protein [Pseudomonadota bacterium]